MIYRLSLIPSKIPDGYFAEKGKVILKLIQKFKGPRIPKTILKKKKVGELPLPNLKTYYNNQNNVILAISTVVDTDGIELSSEINPHIYLWLTDFPKGHEGKSVRRDESFQQMMVGTTKYPHVREWSGSQCHTMYNSKWTVHINMSQNNETLRRKYKGKFLQP